MGEGGAAEALAKASEGLMYRSDTDAPFEAVEWPGEEGKPTKARVLELAGADAKAKARVMTVDAFFRDAAADEGWHDEAERAEAERFQRLVAAIKEALTGVKVFLVGGKEADAYVVGATESGWAGLRTKVART